MRDSGNVAQNGSSISIPSPKTSTSPSRWSFSDPGLVRQAPRPRVQDKHHLMAVHSSVKATILLKAKWYINK